LQDKGLAITGAGQPGFQAPSLTRKNQGGKSRDFAFHRGQSRLVGIFRHLPDWHITP
jgi:hypothetical protein